MFSLREGKGGLKIKSMYHPTHGEQLVFLNRIEGQIRGVRKMVVEGRYCVDILTQLHSIIGAIQRVESNILQRHLESCFTHAISGHSEVEKNKKIGEVIELVIRFRKTA
jgi:DNA-binding FrmR family transcriptional regulator